MTIGIDEQIAYVEYLCEGESMGVQRAILATLRRMKAITDAARELPSGMNGVLSAMEKEQS